ncbi:MAG TPA: hypothetical protein ENH41_02895 [Candidatus Omnitrophica bacterium]|nr:hypothetical protein [Candidatus Omnitrophota bacterium]
MLARYGVFWKKNTSYPLSLLVARIKKDMIQDEHVIYMGVGWLAREGHIILKKTNLGYVAYLSKLSSK